MHTEIYVLIEHLEGRITDISFELLGKARTLATDTGGKVCAILPMYELPDLTRQLGAADTVLLIDDQLFEHFSPEQHVSLIHRLLTERAPRLLMLGSTSTGLDLGAALSARLDIPMVSSCTELVFEGEQLVGTSQMYGGKMMIETAVTAPTAIVQVLAGAFRMEDGRKDAAPEVETIVAGLNPEDFRMTFESYIRPEGGDIDITQAPVLVSVGRGIQQADNIQFAEELAVALGGAVSSSRPVVDQDWLPITRQVGKSGMTVKPRLYLALGISGAPEHVEGMKDAELIVGINTDPTAPIFNIAHYGVVGDVMDIVPTLTERLAEKVQ
jgi:electron transfer flavoprotein alpha subunit